ncbi:MAG: hypothetical protein HY914_05120 [Desulfomonile tiedjei]|nr:hypothetical protein [Desulfomonile tiedjei]
MPRNNTEPYRVINFFDWTGGIQDRRKNPLAFPHNALMGGENVELVDGGLKTRGGISIVSAGSLPDGEVMALKQVRFPTNETSYVVVQVRTDEVMPEESPPVHFIGGSAEIIPRPPHRIWPNTGYDSQNNRIWICSGYEEDGVTPILDLWYFDCETRTFIEVTDYTGDVPVFEYPPSSAYDPTRHCLWIFGTTATGGAETKLVKYDIALNAFIEVVIPPENQTHEVYPAYSPMIYRPTSDSLILFGRNGGDMWVKNYANLALGTLVWSRVECTRFDLDPGEIGVCEHQPAAYDPVRDKIVLGTTAPGSVASATFWQLDCSTSVWTYMPSIVFSQQTYYSDPTMVYCSTNDSYICMGGVWDPPTAPFTETTWLWVHGDDAWQHIEVDAPASDEQLVGARGHISDGTLYLIFGQTIDDAGMNHYGHGVDIFEDICDYIPPPEGGAEPIPATNGLYACPTHLPTTEGVFQQIYDLGAGAGVCSFAVLNDRLVVTEGIAAPPLVTGLSLSDDASDWLVPKAVLVQQAGTSSTGTEGNYYDVSPQVCDKDPDTVANIGNIRSSGALYICTDMPQVQAFWIEMATPNTLSLEDDSRSYSNTVAFTSAAHLNRQDLKATIDHWVQDAGATGHFEDVSNTPLTVGEGNACPDVEVGLEVTLPGGTRYIVDIVDDGEGTGEITLSETTTSQAVTTIHGMTLSSDRVSVRSGFGEAASVWSLAAIDGLSGSFGGGSVRIPLRASEISANAGHIQVTVKSGDLSDSQKVWWSDDLLVCSASHVSIVERAGMTANGTTAPTEITFNGGESGFTASTWSEDIESDIITYAVDETKDYLLIIDVARSVATLRSGQSATAAFLSQTSNAYIDANSKPYFRIGTATLPVQSWNQQTVTGYATASNRYAVTDVSSKPAFPQSERLFVGTTTDVNQVSVISAEDFQGVSVTESVPTGTTLWHAVSFDDRESFSVFVNDAWRTIVQHDSGTTWQYKDAADAWQNASTNDLYTALREAFAIAENHMSGTQLEAIASDQWKETGGIELHITNYMDFAFGMAATANGYPTLTSYTVQYNDAGDTYIYGWSGGAWDAGHGWDDNTAPTGIPWSQTGTVEYLGAGPFAADYSVLNEVPGFWFKFVPSGTSSDCAVSRILYKAPCQPLSNIGDGQPDVPMGFVYVDTSANMTRDYTVEVSDNALTELSKASVPMAPDDYLYVGFCWPFNEIEVTPYAANNTNPAVLSAEYWNGEAWTSLTVTDGTKGSQGKTVSGKGKISWSLPIDWRANIPFDGFFSRGYWIRLSVSAALSSAAAISEVRIYAVPPRLHKYKFAAAVKDRVALLSRPDAWDQADLSRTLEEYGFSGQDSASYRIGGMDRIQCAVAAWNGLLVGKTETWHQLLGCDPSNFAFEGVEAARHIPVNSNVIVKAPMTGLDSGTRSGLFFLNRFGGFVSTGLHTDSEWNTGRGTVLSDSVNWWDGREIPRLALDALHRACGEYWPVKNWIVWAVPMITEPGQTVQTTNNRLIVYDLSLRTWLPPFSIALASIAVAYHHNENAPGKLGEIGLYGGDYHGRIVRLFGPADATDLGAAIPGWVETGWLHFGSPEWLKLIRRLRLFGRTAAGKTIGLKIWVDGNTDSSRPDSSLLLSDLDIAASRFFAREDESLNLQGRFFKLRIEFQDITHLYGLQIGVSLIREWGAL